MELRVSNMLGRYTVINPYLSTLVPKLSLSESPPLWEMAYSGLLFYEFSLTRGYLKVLWLPEEVMPVK